MYGLFELYEHIPWWGGLQVALPRHDPVTTTSQAPQKLWDLAPFYLEHIKPSTAKSKGGGGSNLCYSKPTEMLSPKPD